MNLQQLKNKIHQFSNSSDFQNAFEQLKADVTEAVNIEEPGDHKPYYTNHVARELFQKAADFGLSHLIEGEVDAGFRPISGDTTFLDSAVTSLATPTLVISTDSDTMQVTLTSTTVTDASTYQFQVSSSSDFSSPTTIQNTSSTTATYTVTSVGTFLFRLRACGADNSRSNWTATQNASSETWTPSSITSEAWYDFTDSSTITESSNIVSKVDDKSGKDLHLIVPSGSTGPTSNSKKINDLDVLYFNDSKMENSIPSLTGIDHATNNVLFLTFFFQAQEIKYQFFFALTEYTSSPRLYLRMTDGGSMQLNDVVDLTGMPSANNQNENFLFSVKMAADSSAVFNNGALIDGSCNVKRGPINHINLGKTSHSLFPANASYGEFIMYRGAGTDRAKVEGYIAHKFNYASNLSSNHLYKSSAPIRFTS